MDWVKTVETLPPSGVVVETKDSGGNTQKLIREGNLWWFTDKSMYVYYIPVVWRIV